MGIENINLYTEVDPGAIITRTAPKCSWSNLKRNVDAYVYDDKGVSHFSSDFEHLFEVELVTADDGGFAFHYMLGNVVAVGSDFNPGNHPSLNFFTFILRY